MQLAFILLILSLLIISSIIIAYNFYHYKFKSEALIDTVCSINGFKLNQNVYLIPFDCECVISDCDIQMRNNVCIVKYKVEWFDYESDTGKVYWADKDELSLVKPEHIQVSP